jgi:hypothetical protein
MDQKFLDQAEGYETLGPHYFAAREAAEKFMEHYEPKNFEPMIKKAANTFMEEMQTALEDWFLSNVESNLQGTIWRQIDDSVKALLGGEQWALKRYALGERYDCDKIRAAVAQHIPAELQDASLKDLEAENKRLKEDNDFLRRLR